VDRINAGERVQNSPAFFLTDQAMLQCCSLNYKLFFIVWLCTL